MSVVEASIDIEADPQAVFDFSMDPQKTLEWVTIAREVGETSSGPLRQGYKMDQKLCLRGVSFWVHWELTEYDAPWLARWEGKGPMRSKAIIENRLSEHDGGTRFEYRNEFKTPMGALGAAASKVVTGGIPEREANASLQRLKARLEQR
jgi:uncharacterized protein YndB with AHSA1/START domain